MLPARLARLHVDVTVLAIRAYQMVIRPHLIGQCPFYPSCSHYAIDALQKKGFWAGGGLALRRLIRCRPFARGGYDPVE